MSEHSPTSDARRLLLERLVDDAGLFPPASLDLDAALATHDRHRQGRWSWMLGRFLCPASRLDTLASAVPDWRDGLPVGVILDRAGRATTDGFDAAVEVDLDAVATVTASTGRIRIDAVEVRLAEATAECAGEVASALVTAGVSETATAYMEAPDSTDPESLRATVRAVLAVHDRTGAMVGAKVRCGGTVAGSVPGTDTLAGFVAEAVAAGVPFKATAGLHHPEPAVDEITGDTMHGFLHLAAATALLSLGAIAEPEAAALLGDREPGAVRLDPDGIGWRGQHADGDAIRSSRRRAFHGHGSCSFDEPVADLLSLGILREDS